MRPSWFLAVLCRTDTTKRSVYGELGPAKVILDNGKSYGGVKWDGTFSIPDVHPGTYILSVLAHNFTFDKLRVDVSDSDSLPEVRPYIPGTPLSPPSQVMLPYPILLAPRQRNNYFVPRQTFNLLGMFQNPMMLMMVAAGAMMLGAPYLLKSLDPEALEDFKARQAKYSGIQNSIQSGDFKAGLSALMPNDDRARSTGVSTSGSQSNQTPTKGKGKGRRR
ncbi:hypothetical protein GLOTRDRAFT_124598 [Gloeophyllum trabeum ATCC 11539]|uniref:ER membrane protein complex subunit 7 beta-sandwich domain-containing protein n=1 Tax=Gloeophyllum trabeum (strain ATCC 11539 / FP-39264 / Madison 617) TaxID=670483 RepID=S7S4K3_GLOTA|nr:uncharacterized protein GLOTRDRAFT_124598 [Gloeophyllum trabeum ATCC 11539]EPQ60854.1 hypothetical protein GLOTRDRAFT_124598 [Gloeophyllum trabeum ATCC 11539]